MYVATAALSDPAGRPQHVRGERVSDHDPQLAGWIAQGQVVQQATSPGSDFADTVFDRPVAAQVVDGGVVS